MKAAPGKSVGSNTNAAARGQTATNGRSRVKKGLKRGERNSPIKATEKNYLQARGGKGVSRLPRGTAGEGTYPARDQLYHGLPNKNAKSWAGSRFVWE